MTGAVTKEKNHSALYHRPTGFHMESPTAITATRRTVPRPTWRISRIVIGGSSFGVTGNFRRGSIRYMTIARTSWGSMIAPIAYIWSIALFRFIILMSIFTSFFTVAKLVQVRLGFWKYWRARSLSKAIGTIMLPHEVKAMVMYLVDPRRKFPVTPKDEPPMTMREILHVGRGSMALMAVMALGLSMWNPVGLWYNALWFFSFITAPVILWHYCGPWTRPAPAADGGTRDLLADRRLRTSLDLPGIRD